MRKKYSIKINNNVFKRPFLRLLGFIMIPFLISCEKDLMLIIPEGDEKIVVEGHIEQDAPPVIVLTRSIPVFSTFGQEQLEKAFVHNAEVFVSDNSGEYKLQELNSSFLPPELLKLVAEQ